MLGLFFYVLACLIVQKGVPQKMYCGEKRNVTGVLGGEATLSVDHIGITDITWVTQPNSVIIATTEPGKLKQTMHKLYKGRLKATSDGSLVITNLSREDQAIYTAYNKRQSAKWCAQMYRLTVYDGKSWIPYNLLRNASLHKEDLTDLRTINIIRLALCVFVLCLTSFIFIHHMKNVVEWPCAQPRRPEIMELERKG